jgi:DNA-binding response OmpR family regulator
MARSRSKLLESLPRLVPTTAQNLRGAEQRAKMLEHRVLLIDDDIELCGLLAKCLSSEGMLASIANTGAKGLALLGQDEHSLVVLDVMLPDISGFSILERTRASADVPVLMLTAMNGEEDKVKGLGLGADDYLTKPFGIKEFLARVKALIRRSAVLNHGSPRDAIMRFCGMTIDILGREVFVGGQEARLTAKEFDLLFFLASNKGKTFTKRQLYNQVWNDEYVFDDSNIMSFVSKLRKKIEPAPNSPEYIQTVRGVGYRFNREV